MAEHQRGAEPITMHRHVKATMCSEWQRSAQGLQKLCFLTRLPSSCCCVDHAAGLLLLLLAGMIQEPLILSASLDDFHYLMPQGHGIT
jgi:hypothetical protein